MKIQSTPKAKRNLTFGWLAMLLATLVASASGHGTTALVCFAVAVTLVVASSVESVRIGEDKADA